MTIPIERTRALIQARNFLRNFLDRKKINSKTKITELRHAAYYVLKHFPTELDIEKLALHCPQVLGKPEWKEPIE